MVYQADIPDPNDLISISQGEIKDNFTALNVGFAIDHYAYDVAGAGKHKKITYQAPLVADPDLADPIASLYTKNTTSRSQLYFQNDNNASFVCPITASLGAYGRVSGAGAIAATRYNLPAACKIGVGHYRLVFTNPLVDANYVVLVALEGNYGTIWYEGVTDSQFDVKTGNTSGVQQDRPFSVVVHGEIW